MMQALYLTNMFNILLDYPPALNAVDKVIWYRYEDILQSVGESAFDPECDDLASWQGNRLVSNPEGPITTVTRNRPTNEIAYIKHYFGLVDERGDQKPAYCALQEVTDRGICPQVILGESIYLPFLVDNPFDLALPRAKSIPTSNIPLAIHTTHESVISEQISLVVFPLILVGTGTIIVWKRRNVQ